MNTFKHLAVFAPPNLPHNFIIILFPEKQEYLRKKLQIEIQSPAYRQKSGMFLTRSQSGYLVIPENNLSNNL